MQENDRRSGTLFVSGQDAKTMSGNVDRTCFEHGQPWAGLPILGSSRVAIKYPPAHTLHNPNGLRRQPGLTIPAAKDYKLCPPMFNHFCRESRSWPSYRRGPAGGSPRHVRWSWN